MLARAAAGSAPGGASGSSGGGSAGAGAAAGGDSEQTVTDVMRRVREEQEQLGRLIDHPF
jgi:hypothetical protein